MYNLQQSPNATRKRKSIKMFNIFHNKRSNKNHQSIPIRTKTEPNNQPILKSQSIQFIIAHNFYHLLTQSQINSLKTILRQSTIKQDNQSSITSSLPKYSLGKLHHTIQLDNVRKVQKNTKKKQEVNSQIKVKNIFSRLPSINIKQNKYSPVRINHKKNRFKYNLEKTLPNQQLYLNPWQNDEQNNNDFKDF